jgi:hypothetical protein
MFFLYHRPNKDAQFLIIRQTYQSCFVKIVVLQRFKSLASNFVKVLLQLKSFCAKIICVYQKTPYLCGDFEKTFKN